ncbi:MAG: ankyrin repeat domain-containing protein [Vulcanimicrobiota bacterium]
MNTLKTSRSFPVAALITSLFAVLFILVVTPALSAKDIFQAVQDGDLAAVKRIVQKNPASLKGKDSLGETPFLKAAKLQYVKITEFLISSGADINAKDRKGNTALHLIAPDRDRGCDDDGMAKVLVNKGIRLNEKNLKGETPLLAALKNSQTIIALYLIAKGADVNAADLGGLTPLLIAAGMLDEQIVEALVKKGANVNAASRTHDTPLMMASIQGSSAITTLLISKGARVDICSASGLGNLQLIKDILKKDPNLVKTKDGNGDSPLHYATDAGKKDAAALLISLGADVNAKNKSLWTPLHFAALHGNVDMAKVLVDHGARRSEKNDEGLTPFQMAEMNGNNEVMKFLGGGK